MIKILNGFGILILELLGIQQMLKQNLMEVLVSLLVNRLISIMGKYSVLMLERVFYQVIGEDKTKHLQF